MLNFLRILPVILALAGAGYAYHWFQMELHERNLRECQTQSQELRNQVSALKLQTSEQEKTLENLRDRNQKQRENMANLSQQNQDLASQRDRYISIFRKHDLTRLSLAKPGLIESRINSGTQDVFDQLEEDTQHEQSNPPGSADD